MDVNAMRTDLIGKLYDVDSPDIITQLSQTLAQLIKKKREDESVYILQHEVLGMIEDSMREFYQAKRDGNLEKDCIPAEDVFK